MVAGSGAVAVAVVSVLALKDGLGGVSELEAITSSLLEVRLSKCVAPGAQPSPGRRPNQRSSPHI